LAIILSFVHLEPDAVDRRARRPQLLQQLYEPAVRR